MLLTSFHSISCSDENRKQLWCVSDEWQSNLSEHEAVFVSFRVFDGSSEMWLRSFCILRRPFSALHRSQLYRHLLRILSHFLSTQAQNIWSLSNIVKNIVCLHRNPISCDQLEKNLHPSVWEGFSLLDSTLLVKTMLALFRADEPICCGRLEKLPLTIPGVTRKKTFWFFVTKYAQHKSQGLNI